MTSPGPRSVALTFPVEVMKLTLIFDGELPSTGNGSRKTAKKWELRQAFHDQLSELWATHPVLTTQRTHSVPLGGFWMIERHHSEPFNPKPPGENDLLLYAPITKHGVDFIPLVRESMALVCSLDILFLRKEEPGALLKQGGDLDNRIKTLVDGLRMPQHIEEMAGSEAMPQPCYCLLESDSLVTDVRVRTERLLSRPNSKPSEVRLIIDVLVKATQVRGYNLPMVGD